MCPPCARPTTCVCEQHSLPWEGFGGHTSPEDKASGSQNLLRLGPSTSHCLTGETGKEQQGSWGAAARLGRCREGLPRVAGPPVPQSWSRSCPPPLPRRPPSVSGTPHAPAGPAPPGPSSPPPPVDTEWAESGIWGRGAHPSHVFSLCFPRRAPGHTVQPFLRNRELLQDPDPSGPHAEQQAEAPLLISSIASQTNVAQPRPRETLS